MIKLIATDLDDTFLRDDKTVSRYTLETVKMCRDSGIKFMYATARGFSSTLLVPVEEFDGRVTVNGANGYVGDELVHRQLVNVVVLRELLVACSARGFRTGVENGDRHLANFQVDEMWNYIENYQIVDFDKISGEAEKAYILIEDMRDADFIKSLLPAGHHFTVSRDGMVQIMNSQATKSNGIEAVARRLGIDMSEVASFGDDLNDVDMLKRTGIGVAMGNAIDEVKSIADHVCDTNEEDGMAVWIRENILR